MGRIFKDKKGYKRFSGSKKLVHRWAMSKKVGRPLRRSEAVHHRNGDRGNFRRGNLELFKSQKTHMRKRHSKKRGLF